MGRRQQTNMPLTLEQLQPVNQQELKQAVQRRDEDIPKSEEYEKVKSKKLDTLADGENILVKYYKTGCWDTEATIIQRREDGLSYIIEDEHGHAFIRGRRLLKPKPKHTTSDRILRSHNQKQEEEANKPPNQRRYPQRTRNPLKRN